VEERIESLRTILSTIREDAQRALTLLEGKGDQHSLGWKCKWCGYVKHFTRPVPIEVVSPCPRCKNDAFQTC
jgi:predicted Zn-ribbon and HTH transcriptional regulator